MSGYMFFKCINEKNLMFERWRKRKLKWHRGLQQFSGFWIQNYDVHHFHTSCSGEVDPATTWQGQTRVCQCRYRPRSWDLDVLQFSSRSNAGQDIHKGRATGRDKEPWGLVLSCTMMIKYIANQSKVPPGELMKRGCTVCCSPQDGL